MNFTHKISDKKKILLTCLGLAAASFILPFLFFKILAVFAPSNGDWMRTRLRTAVKYFPTIAATPVDKKLILVMGSSEVESAFNPLVFDPLVGEKIDNVISYNLGFRNINMVLKRLTGRIARELKEKNRTADLILVKVLPSNLTKKARNGLIEAIVRDTTVSIFQSPSEMFRLILRNPRRGLFLLTYGTIFDGSTSHQATAFIKRKLYTPPNYLIPQEKRRAMDLHDIYNRFWNAPELHALPGWELENRGHFNFNRPQSESLYNELEAKLKTHELKQVALDSHIARHGILELQFSPESITEFVWSLHDLKSVAKKVVVFNVPLHPIVELKDDAAKQLEVLYRLIEKDGGVEFWDYSKENVFTEDDYIDDLHLNDSGGMKLMKLLARDTIKTFEKAQAEQK